jgi:hypothetical protein
MDTIAITVLILSTSAALLLAPDLHLHDLVEPTIGATLATPVVLTALLVLRLGGWRSIFERRLLATFLLFMPTVYLTSFTLHGGGAPWPTLEVAGQAIFAALAFAGLRYSGWILVAGLAGHGLLWDLWHHGRTPFVPDWYTVGCLVVDVGWAFYAGTRVAVWSAEHRRTADARHAGASGTIGRVAATH